MELDAVGGGGLVFGIVPFITYNVESFSRIGDPLLLRGAFTSQRSSAPLLQGCGSWGQRHHAVPWEDQAWARANVCREVTDPGATAGM